MEKEVTQKPNTTYTAQQAQEVADNKVRSLNPEMDKILTLVLDQVKEASKRGDYVVYTHHTPFHGLVVAAFREMGYFVQKIDENSYRLYWGLDR